jgi:acyl-CoA thioester hydrolase
MPRLYIEFPETFVFSTDLAVRVSDLNYGGHVGQDKVLTLMQEARTLFYRSIGFESEIKLEGTVGQIIADAAVVYKSESFLGDILTFRIAVAEIQRVRFELLYRITNKETGKEVALGKTGIVCFDYASRKIASIPDSLRKKLGGEGL